MTVWCTKIESYCNMGKYVHVTNSCSLFCKSWECPHTDSPVSVIEAGEFFI